MPAALPLGTVEEIIRSRLDADARLRGIEVLSDTPGDSVLRLDLDGRESVVLKTRRGPNSRRDFDAEAHQLEYLAALGDKAPLRVPKVLARSMRGPIASFPYLLLSKLPGVPLSAAEPFMDTKAKHRLLRCLGAQLGRMHREATGDLFTDVLPSPVAGHRAWPQYFSHAFRQRILDLARTDRLDPATMEALRWIQSRMAILLETRDRPRLVHGGLRGSRILCDDAGDEWHVSGVLSPSLAYAHREVDLALLELDVPLDDGFFDAYRGEIPLDDGFERRKLVYQLHSVLEAVQLHGGTHWIVLAMDTVRRIVRAER